MTFVEEPISVREAILLCIKHEIKGAESQLESFDNSKPNRLRGDQITALEGNLACIYENVKVTGGGKRGKVYLSGLKEDIQQKEDGRAENEGKPPTKEILLMSKYIHNELMGMYIQDKHMEYALNGWVKHLGILQKDDLPANEFEGRIREVHVNSSFHVIKPSEIVRNFKDAIYSMSTDVVGKCFNVLGKAGSIEYLKHFNVVKLDNKKEYVEEIEYKEISSARTALLKELGSNIQAYNRALNDPNPNEKDKAVLLAVKEMFAKEFDCKFIYESYHVYEVVGNDDYLNKDGFDDAYWNEFIRRTERRQRFYDNKYGENETWLWRKLWLFHVLVLIEYMGIDTAGKLLLCEMEKSERIQQVSVAYQAWQDKDKPIGFGGVVVEEDSPEDIEENLKDMF